MLTKLRLKIANYLLLKELKKTARDVDLITLSRAKKIGILFDSKSSKDVLLVKSLVKEFLTYNIDVSVLGFVEHHDYQDFHLSTLHINYFNLNDLNWFFLPKSKTIDSFQSHKYDIVINLSLLNSFSTKYIALLSNSKFTIGVFSSDYKLSYDMMFNLKVPSLSYFIKELTHYLDLINKNNEK